MEEGDDYVPNMSSMTSQVPPQTQPPPPNPYQFHQQHHGMGGQGMLSPHLQHMSMQNPYMNVPHQTPQPAVVVPSAKAAKSRSRKKADTQHNQQQIDPMQRMAAMSHNPMAYAQPQQPMGGYPPSGYPPQGYRPPPGYPPHPQMYPPHPMAPQQQPQNMGGQPRPQGYPPGYPPQGYAPYPGYPPQMTPQGVPRYPPMAQPPHPYYMDNPYYQQQQQMRTGGQGGEGQSGWNPPHMNNPYAQTSHDPSQIANQMNNIQLELSQLQQHVQRMYAQPRTPILEQEISRFEQRIQMLQQAQADGAPTAASSQKMPPSQQFAPPPGSSAYLPPSNSYSSSRDTPHMNSPPVSVTGGSNQIQVNIKPEQAGHTLISVYQMPEGSGYPSTKQPEVHPKPADSVPPEPIPSQHIQENMPLDPYGMTSRQQGINAMGQSLHHSQQEIQQIPSTQTPSSSSIQSPITQDTNESIPIVKEEPMTSKQEPSTASSSSSLDEDSVTAALLDQPPRAPLRPSEVEEDEEIGEKRDEEEEEEDEDTRPAIDQPPSEDATRSTTPEKIEVKEEVNGIENEEKSRKEEEENRVETVVMPPQEVPLPATMNCIAKMREEESREDSATRDEGSMESTATSLALSEENSLSATPIALNKGTQKKKAATTSKTPKVSAKKRKTSLEESDQDDDFIVDSKKNRKKKTRPTIEKEETREDFPMELIEKRRSGRMKATTARYAEEERDEGHAAQVMRELDLMDERDDSLISDEMVGPYFITENTVVEKILNIRQKDGKEEFLTKYKGRAYIHCEWKTLKELEDKDKRVSAKVKRFKAKKTSFMDMDDEDFNQDFTIVERVISVERDGEEEIGLVKWKSLPYDEATWESISILPHDKVEIWRKRQIIDPCKSKEKARPEPHEWKKLERNAVWKDGNTLREYQFEGVNWLLYCYHQRQNCILADEMGLGKTVQTITFLSKVADYGIHGPFLVVVPLSTVHNWMREFDTWTDMNVIVYHGSSASRQLLQHYEFFYSEPREDDPDYKLWRPRLIKLDAIITTFEMVVTDCEVLRKIPFRLCVIDEAHRLKNRNCKLLTGGLSSFKMEHRVLLTGTPLQNSIEELFSLLHFLHPAQFSSPSAFLEQFGQCQTDQQVQKLQEILKPMMLRRLKEDVEKTLEPKQETIVEVQLSDTQKKYYRAILERNFSHLCKGNNAPALMNAMMELRKCCNHPFLIQGAEEQIVSEFKLMHPEWEDEQLQTRSLVLASGKMVLIDKLLPKLKQDGHKVLIFSQMVKVLDLIEEFIVSQQYTFERIDGNVRGDVRQAAIDRFSKPDSDRFVFLLCTRAGGLGINLTAADTVIIFDSDWNPQNDLQAQARCHRIGQTKTVKVYRLVTANTYEREMFEKASLKLGLDKAVLQSTHSLRDQNSSLSKKDVEELLKKGAYGSILDDDTEGSKFSEEDIETILQRRTTTITLEAGVKGSTFSKATFNASHNEDIDIDDPNFWSKWAQKANVDAERALAGDERELIVSEPRQRKKRFEPAENEGGEESDTSSEGGRRKKKDKDRKRRKGDEDSDYITYRPDELAFNKSEYFKVEKLLGSWSWGRWTQMKESGDMEVNEMDIEHMARTLLLHCLREYRGDDKTKEFIWKLIHPPGQKYHRLGGKSHLLTDGWTALPEYNPPNFALDTSFQRHVHRHANKLLSKMEQLHHLDREIIGESAGDIMKGKEHKEINVNVPSLGETMCNGWDTECDKSLIIGVFRHGLEGVENCATDNKLIFPSKKELIDGWPSISELQMRARRLIAVSQRAFNDPLYDKQNKWSKREEQEFMRVLRSYGLRDIVGDVAVLDWQPYKKLALALDKKNDDEFQEQLHCVLAMCSRVQGGDLTPLDAKRALAVEAISAPKAQRLMARLQLTRRIHHLVSGGIEIVTPLFKLCSTEAMPTGWTSQHDRDLLLAVDEYGIDNISATLLNRPLFQKIIRPAEKSLLRRVLEICQTLESGKWNGAASIEQIDDSDDERKRIEANRGRRGKTTSNTTADKDKMRTLLQHSLISKQIEEMPILLMQSMLQASLMGNSGQTAQVAAQQAQMALLQSLFTVPSSSSLNPASALEEAINLCKKEAERQQAAAVANQFGLQQLLALANLPPETRLPVINNKTKERIQGEGAPMVKNLEAWLISHPDFTLDMSASTPSSSKDKRSSTPAPNSGASTPRPSTHKSTVPPSPSPKLEPGEIPKPSTSTSLTPSTSSIQQPSTSSASDPPIPVCNRSTNTQYPSSQWPTLSKLASWLDCHPEANVHSNGLALALPVLGTTHGDRIGQADVLAAKNSLEQLQLQMLLQQAMMNPLMMAGMAGMPGTSKQDESALQQQLLLSMLGPSLGGMVDPSTALVLASLQGGLTQHQPSTSRSSTTPSTSRISSSRGASSSSSSTPKASSIQKAKLPSKLAAVVEKLANNSQS